MSPAPLALLGTRCRMPDVVPAAYIADNKEPSREILVMCARFFIASLLALFFAAGLFPLDTQAHEATSKGVTVAHPWVRATPDGATVGSGFLEIKTDKDTADRLVGIASPVATTAEVHSMTMDGAVMKMRRLDGIDLKPGSSHVLAPMGEHIMLLGLKQPLKEGDLVKLTLTFANAGPIEVEASVEPMGAMGPHGFDHQPVDDPMTGTMPHDMSHDEMSGGMHHQEQSK